MVVELCNDLRLGGTLSATGITGGTSINSTALHIINWAPLFGTPGMSASPRQINGRPGMVLAGDRLGKARFPQLVVGATRWGPTAIGSLVETDEAHQIWANTDDFLDLASRLDTYLEVDLPDDTSRFIKVSNIDPGEAIDWRDNRRFSIPFITDWPWWRVGGDEESESLTGSNFTWTVPGDKTIYDAKLVFSTNAVLTHNDEGWTLEVTGASNPVTIDLGASPRTVTESGASATNRVRRSSRDWAWFPPGLNDVTVSAGTVTLTYRPQYA